VSDRCPVAVVVVTRDRRDELLGALRRLVTLPERPRVVVADNASSDATAQAVRRAFPTVEVLELPENLGAGARTVAAQGLDTPYVAFADDDSWWAPGALARAAAVLGAHPRLALLAARVLVGPGERLDPVSAGMANAPLGRDPDLPGPSVLGFVACGAVARRDAFLAAGGFDARFGVGGEEEVLALDLAAAGWGLAYVDDVVAHHHPARVGRGGRSEREVRNALWSAWLRRSPADAVARSGAALRGARSPAVRARALRGAVRGLPWVLRERRPVGPDLERALRTLG